MVWPRQKDARGQNTKINYGIDTREDKKKRTSKKNVDGRSTSSHDNDKFRNRSVEKQGGLAFGLWKTATGVTKPGRQKDTETSKCFKSPYMKQRCKWSALSHRTHCGARAFFTF
jgi:hypothetical protein